MSRCRRGYSLVWSGQFEYMQRAAARLRIIVPVTLFAGVLAALFQLPLARAESLLVLLLPFALTGGVWLLFALELSI